MIKIKEMPYQKKYDMVLSTLKLEDIGLALIEKQLGKQATDDLRKEWQKGVKPIPENASDKEKYEIAFSKLAWMGGTKFNFIRSRMGENGLNQVVRADVEFFKKLTPRAALLLMGIIRAISPSTALSMTFKQAAYNMQYAGPISISELSKNRAVMNLTPCIMLDFPGGEDICPFCLRETSLWLREQFKLDTKIERKGKDCSTTVAILKK